MHVGLHEADSAVSKSMQLCKATVQQPFYVANCLYKKTNIATKQDKQDGQHYNLVLSCTNNYYTIISMNVLSHCTKQNALSKSEALRVSWLKIHIYCNVPLCPLAHTYQ